MEVVLGHCALLFANSPKEDIYRADYFESIIRSHIPLSFSQSTGAPAKKPKSCCVAGPSHAIELSQLLDPVSATSSRRDVRQGCDVLISSTNNPCDSSQHVVEELTAKLANIAYALKRKEKEVENLQSVLKELAETRAEAIRLKATSIESFLEMQSDYGRVIKAAQLAQQTSRHNLSKLNSLRSQLRETQDQLYKERTAGRELQHSNCQLKQQNEELQGRLAVLECAAAAPHLADCRQSLCQYMYEDRAVMRKVGLY